MLNALRSLQIHTVFWWGDVKKASRLEVLHIDGSIILKELLSVG